MPGNLIGGQGVMKLDGWPAFLKMDLVGFGVNRKW
jgi:hypothetical protein